MHSFQSAETAQNDWQLRSIFFPRIGLMLDRNGMHRRLIMPGRYLTRRSRSIGKRLYRFYAD